MFLFWSKCCSNFSLIRTKAWTTLVEETHVEIGISLAELEHQNMLITIGQFLGQSQMLFRPVLEFSMAEAMCK